MRFTVEVGTHRKPFGTIISRTETWDEAERLALDWARREWSAVFAAVEREPGAAPIRFKGFSADIDLGMVKETEEIKYQDWRNRSVEWHALGR